MLQRTVYDGPVKRKKGDVYFVDCAVTGTDSGTSDDPKFALFDVFHDIIVPKVEKLVEKGGQFEGYTIVLQGDQAGPHQGGDFNKKLIELIKPRGWLYEPQAPQMPHANNLDLAVFPCMSKMHSALTRQNHGLRVLKKDEIWQAAFDVFENLPSEKIARGFIQCHKLLEKVIKEKGGNSFLRKKKQDGLHCNISNEFELDVTGCGLVRKDKKTIDPPTARTDMQTVRPHAPFVTY